MKSAIIKEKHIKSHAKVSLYFKPTYQNIHGESRLPNGLFSLVRERFTSHNKRKKLLEEIFNDATQEFMKLLTFYIFYIF